MHVADGLARVRAGIKDDAVAALRDSLGDRDIVGMRDDLCQQAILGLGKLAHAGVVGTRDNENVYRCLRIDVTERDGPIVAGHYRRGNVGCGNAAEQALGHGGDLNVCRVRDASDIYGCNTANPTMHHPSGVTASPVSGFPSPEVSDARARLRGMRWAWGEVQKARRAGPTPACHEDPFT